MPQHGLQVDTKVNIKEFGPITRYAVGATARAIRDRGRLDIAQAGHFGRRFQMGLQTRVDRIQGGSGYIISVQQKPNFMKVFQHGGTSVGKPMLWIPADLTVRVRARNFKGPLFRPKGKNVLMGADRKVKYIGISSVVNRKRMHIEQIAMEEAKNFTRYIGEAYAS